MGRKPLTEAQRKTKRRAYMNYEVQPVQSEGLIDVGELPSDETVVRPEVVKAERVSIMGRPTMLTPELVKKAEGYFEHVAKNPIKKNVITNGILGHILVEAPPTIAGLCIYLGIRRQTLFRWCTEGDTRQTELAERLTEIAHQVRLHYDEYLTRNALVENINPRFAAFLASSDLNKRESVDAHFSLETTDPHRIDPEEQSKLRRIFG